MPELDLERPYRDRDPLDMDDAREAARRVARLRRDAEAAYRRAYEEAAKAEAEYRRIRAGALLTAKVEHSTGAQTVADGEGEVREALVKHKVAEGMVEAAKERLKGVEGERSMLKSLIEWSSTIQNVMRASGGMRHEPANPEPRR